MGPLIHPVVRREGIPNFIAKLDHLFLNMSSAHFAHAKRVLHDFLVADLSQGEEHVLRISEIVDIAITRRLTGAPALVRCVRMVVLDDVRPKRADASLMAALSIFSLARVNCMSSALSSNDQHAE